MKRARFLVFPSIGYETFGMSRAGSCSVRSRYGWIEAGRHSGVGGRRAEPACCSIHMIRTNWSRRSSWAWSHPVSMNEMGAAARRRILQHYTAEKSLRRADEDLQVSFGKVRIGAARRVGGCVTRGRKSTCSTTWMQPRCKGPARILAVVITAILNAVDSASDCLPCAPMRYQAVAPMWKYGK